MHGTTIGIGAIKSGSAIIAQSTPIVKARAKRNTLSYIDTEMAKESGDGGITPEL